MKLKAIFWTLCITIFSYTAIAQDIYSWEDEDGIINFSENPPPPNVKNSNKVTIASEAPKHEYQSPKQPKTSAKKITPKIAKPAPKQERIPLDISIINPRHDQSIRSNRGIISILTDLNRKLDVGENLQLVFDGNLYGAPSTRGYWELKNIDRGTHTIAIRAYEDGKIIASTNIVTVHLHRGGK